MKVKLRRVGNSYTVTVPAEIVDELGLAEGADLDVVVREDRVVYEPVADTWNALRDRLRRQAEAFGVDDASIARAVEQTRRGGEPSE